MKIVTAGIICYQGKFLIAQRLRTKQPPLLWEFPGGKLEAGETLEECLKREIKEEFDLDINVGKYLMCSPFDYEFGSIKLEVFFAEASTDEIKKLDSHETYRWVETFELDGFEFTPADIPIVERLKAMNFKA